jgi:iron complex outermembrane receptor protein
MRSVYSLVLLGWAAVAGAQDTTTRRDTARLGPTIVTVTRIPVELARAPFAVGVTTRDEIQRGKPGLALDEALAGIAGVQVDNRFNYALGERITIRGFGARAQFGVRGVRVLLDGIPMTLADGQTSLNNVDVSTLSRAEVIRGPASALHGNAAGGVIQLETDVISPDRSAGGSFRADVGDHGLRRHQLWLGGRRDSTAVSVVGSRLFFDGFRQWNDATNDHIGFVVRNGQTRRALTINGNWAEYDAKNPGGLNTALLAANRDTVSTNNFNNRTGERGRQGQVGASWTERLGPGSLVVSAHGLRRQVDNPIPGRIVVIDRDAGGARVALNAAPTMAGRALSLTAGAEYQMQKDDRRNFVNTGGARGADTLDQLEHVRNVAIFAQASTAIFSRLRLMVGARFDRIGFQAEDRLIGTGNPDDSGDRTMSEISPSVGLTWQATSMLDVYSNYSTSFETPTTTELANRPTGAGGFNPILEPQRTRSIEVGLNGRLRVVGIGGSYQLSAYNAHVRDALIPFFVPSDSGRTFFRNAGSTEHRGVEVATTLVFPRDLSLRGTFTHTDARFDNYVVTAGTPAVTTVFNGNRVPGVAANHFDATLRYQPGRLFFDFESRAQSRIFVNDANGSYADSYFVHSARAGLSDVRVSQFAFTPHIGLMNVFDRPYITSVTVNAFGGRFFEPGPPRSLYGGLIARF